MNAQWDTYEAVSKASFERQQQMKRKADDLQRLAMTAQTAQGQMQALSYANQFASMQTGQLMQLRQQLEAMQQVLTVKAQTDLVREEREKAAEELLNVKFEKVQDPAYSGFSRTRNNY